MSNIIAQSFTAPGNGATASAGDQPKIAGSDRRVPGFKGLLNSQVAKKGRTPDQAEGLVVAPMGHPTRISPRSLNTDEGFGWPKKSLAGIRLGANESKIEIGQHHAISIKAFRERPGTQTAAETKPRSQILPELVSLVEKELPDFELVSTHDKKPPGDRTLEIEIQPIGRLAVKATGAELNSAEAQLMVDSRGAKEWLIARLRALGMTSEMYSLKAGNLPVVRSGPGRSSHPEFVGAVPLTKLQANRVRGVMRSENRDSLNVLANDADKSEGPGESTGKTDEDSGRKTGRRIGDYLRASLSGNGQRPDARSSDAGDFLLPPRDSNQSPPGTDTLPGTGSVTELPSARLAGPEMIQRAQLSEMIQRIMDLAKQSSFISQKLEVELEVQDVGSLIVDAAKQQDKINLQINVENTELKRMLDSQLRPLLDQFTKEGIEIGKLEVSLRQSHSGSQQDEPASDKNLDLPARNERRAIEHPPDKTMPKIQRDFGYNSIEVWA